MAAPLQNRPHIRQNEPAGLLGEGCPGLPGLEASEEGSLVGVDNLSTLWTYHASLEASLEWLPQRPLPCECWRGILQVSGETLPKDGGHSVIRFSGSDISVGMSCLER
jgi:hypothetical protein